MNRLRSLILVVMLVIAIPMAAQARVLGKLGQTVKQAYIYASPSLKSRPYYKAKAYEYLIINPAKSDSWTKVKLNNGTDGYILSESIAKLPYDVTDAVQKKTSRPAARPNNTTEPPLTAPPAEQSAIPGYALRFVGTPYKWGGEDLRNGIDCSAFVKKMYGQVVGTSLPRTAAEQALVGQKIERLEDLRSGDRLYFWDKKRGRIGHTGIYMGNGYFIHSSSHKGVNTDYLDVPRWRNILVAARR